MEQKVNNNLEFIRSLYGGPRNTDTSLSFVKSLTEARLFRYEDDFKNKSVPQMAKVLYLLMLLVEVLRHFDSQFVKNYSRQTYLYGSFRGIRSYATDLHNVIASLADWDVRKTMKGENGLTVPEFMLNRYFRDLTSGARAGESSLDRQLFYKLQSDLKVSDGELSLIRRNLTYVQYIDKQEMFDMAERVNRILDSTAIYSDLQWHYKTSLRNKLLSHPFPK